MALSVYVKALVLTAVVFILGISAGWYLDASRTQAAQGELSALRLQAEQARVGMVFFETFKSDPEFCAVFGSEMAAQLQRVGRLGEQLESLRVQNKLDESYVRFERDDGDLLLPRKRGLPRLRAAGARIARDENELPGFALAFRAPDGLERHGRRHAQAALRSRYGEFAFPRNRRANHPYWPADRRRVARAFPRDFQLLSFCAASDFPGF